MSLLHVSLLGRGVGISLLFAVLARGVGPGGGAVVASGFINPSAPYPECHASTIVEASPGHFVAAWFGGTRERAPDVGIWVARGDGRHWQTAIEVATGKQERGPRLPTWNPVLFKPPGQELVLFYKVGPSPSTWWGMMMRSADGGATWGRSQRLPPGILGPIKDKPLLLPEGAWLCGSSTEGSGWHVHFERTGDGGRTWQETGPVDDPSKLGAIQPTLLAYARGPGETPSKWEAICRTRHGVLAATWSTDQGRSWSPLEAMSLPNPNSGVDAVTLSDGRQLLVYNNAAPPADRPEKGPRYPLDVALSRNGVEWRHVLTLESKPSGAGYAYPAVIQGSNGLVYVTYTWSRKHIKFVVLDPAKL